MASQSVPHLGVLDRPAEQSASIRRVTFASFIGTSIEWYDFFSLRHGGSQGHPKQVEAARCLQLRGWERQAPLAGHIDNSHL